MILPQRVRKPRKKPNSSSKKGNISFRDLLLAIALVARLASAEDSADPTKLPRNRFRSGEEMLQAFKPVSALTRESIVKVRVNADIVALGTIVDADGLILTKASELKPGKLTCWLADDREVKAEVLSKDEEADIALLRAEAKHLHPVEWTTNEVHIGQWAITPGIAQTPHAVGIISALPRKIRPQRAFIGIQFDIKSSAPKVEKLMPGLGAEKAGLQEGDIIMAVNDTPVTNREQVVEIVRELREGQVVKLKMQREKANYQAEVPLKTLSEESEDSFSQRRLNRLQGQVSKRAEGFPQALEHDTVLKPWLCGGPLVNLDGKAIGLNIARASRVSTYALPATFVKRIFNDLSAVQPVSGNRS